MNPLSQFDPKNIEIPIETSGGKDRLLSSGGEGWTTVTHRRQQSLFVPLPPLSHSKERKLKQNLQWRPKRNTKRTTQPEEKSQVDELFVRKPHSVIILKEFFPKELLSGEHVESVHMVTYDDSHLEEELIEEEKKVDSNALSVNFGETSVTT